MSHRSVANSGAARGGPRPRTSRGRSREVVARLAAAPTGSLPATAGRAGAPAAQTRTLTDLPPVRDRELASLVANQAGRILSPATARRSSPMPPGSTNGVGRVTTRSRSANRSFRHRLGREGGGTDCRIDYAVGMFSAAAAAPDGRARGAGADSAPYDRPARHWACGAWLVAGALYAVRLVIERRDVDAQLAAADAPLARDARRADPVRCARGGHGARPRRGAAHPG